MSLLSVAQGEAAYNVASNLDTAETEFTRKTGSTASNISYGTFTQSSDSLTGDASYIFGSNAHVVYAGLGTNGGFNNFIQEFVFKKSTKPASGSTHNLSAIPASSGTSTSPISIDSNGYLTAIVRGGSTSNTLTNSTDLCDEKWHHVVVSYIDGTNGFRLYIDGTLITSTDTTGNASWFSTWNIGSRLATDLTTADSYFDGKIDFAALYTGATYTTNGMDSFVANHLATFSNRVLAAPALTASGLAVQPAITTIRSVNYAASPATASTLFPEAIQSARDNFTLLDTYLHSLSLEQWYSFDSYKNILNAGSGGQSSWIFDGNSDNDITSGVQGSGAIRFTGSANDGYIAAINNTPISSEITDGNFSLGFWIKKTNIDNGANIVAYALDADGLAIQWNSSGGITTNVHLSNQDHTISSSTDITDGNWHYVAVRMSGTTLQMWIDNVSIGTYTVNHNWSDLTSSQFGGNNIASISEKMYLSQYYVAPASVVTTTEMTNIWNYGQATVQAGAAMAMPKFSRDNALNEYVLAKSPLLYFKMDESGTPLNSGSLSANMSINGSNYTSDISSPNYKAYSFSNRDTQITGSWTAASGTFSTYNRQTLLMYAKYGSGVQMGMGAASSFGGTLGQGLALQGLANGTLRLRVNDAEGFDSLSTSYSFADDNYHMIVCVKDNGTMKIYIDGIEQASMTSAVINLTDLGQVAIGGVPGGVPPASSRTLFIDEFAVFNTAFSAQDAFEAYQKVALVQDTTATALMAPPTTSLGYGPTINPGVSTATALLVDPTQLDTIAPTIDPMTVTAMFQMPNFAATKNTNNAANVMIASAQGEDPAVAGNGIVGALHMDASAYFPSAYARIAGRWNADPVTVSAEMVEPGLATTLGALIKPQSLNASAFFALPPAYYLVTDDRWYQRLQLVDYDSNTANGNIAFFNTSTDIYRGGGYSGWNAPTNTNVFNSYYGYNLTDSPLPAAYAGTYDPQNRKALRIRNIALVVTDGFAYSGTNWTFETYIKTTKKNQILFVGKQLGDPSNAQSQDFNTAWRLKDGKISLNQEKSTRLGFPKSTDDIAFTGFKDIADGEWHHIIVQFRQTGEDVSAPRTQVFIDGELDIQRYGYSAYPIHQVGFNSPDVNAYSDFETSAIALNQGSFVLERETHLNYYAATGIIPVEAPVATASATLTLGNKGRGNRGRALMLYFWPTFKLDSPYYLPYQRFMNGQAGLGFTTHDQGTYGSDPDTFYPIATQLGNSANQFYDWDIWPCPVTNYPGVDTYIGDSHPILKDGIFGETDKGLSYINPVTANERYLNLQEDLKDLSQFDMICFRNYPDDSNERDVYGTTAKGIADPYFNLLDKTLFEEFLVSLRDAVDSGISLFVTNPQLAVDMGFIDTYHQVTALQGVGSDNGDYTPVKLNDPLATGSPVLNIDYTVGGARGNAYEDYYRNNYHQVVNTIPGLTDDPAYIWKDEAYYKADGLEYGELDRVWSHIEYNPGLQLGDKFLISSMINAYGYYAVPIDAVKAGKVITKFADTYMHGTVERVNPYRNYATTIAIEPGTVVAGKQIGAKVFISFTDNVGNQQSPVASYLNPGSNTPIENRLVELKSDYWIDYAYSTGSITDIDRDYYKSLPQNIDRVYPNGGITYNALKYWTLNGQDLLATTSAFGDNADIGTDTADSIKKGKAAARTRAGMRRKNTVSTSSQPSYAIVSSWVFKLLSVPIPSINTRALWWLSERLEYETLPQRPLALEADAFMPQPVITGYEVASVNAQAALASATIVETDLRSGTLSINSAPLPMTATAQLVPLGLNIAPGVATASARLTTNFSTVTSKDDDIVLYVMHEDPILYIREDAIK